MCLPLVHVSGTSWDWPIPLTTKVRRTSAQSVPLGCRETAAHRSRHPAKITTTTFPEAIMLTIHPHSAITHTPMLVGPFSTVCYTCGTKAPVRFHTTFRKGYLNVIDRQKRQTIFAGLVFAGVFWFLFGAVLWFSKGLTPPFVLSSNKIAVKK